MNDKCSYCKKSFNGFRNTDKYHRLTPLCDTCYKNPIAAKATASVPDDPDSWWNKPLKKEKQAR